MDTTRLVLNEKTWIKIGFWIFVTSAGDYPQMTNLKSAAYFKSLDSLNYEIKTFVTLL